MPVLAQSPGADFALVEIDPLLAYQFHVLTDHSARQCDALKREPTTADLLPICLPSAVPQEEIRISQQGHRVFWPRRSLNVRLLEQGWFQTENKVGIVFGVGLPLVHVVRCNGKCYLCNGFHRAVGSRQRGATHIPCLIRDVATHAEAGVQQTALHSPRRY